MALVVTSPHDVFSSTMKLFRVLLTLKMKFQADPCVQPYPEIVVHHIDLPGEINFAQSPLLKHYIAYISLQY